MLGECGCGNGFCRVLVWMHVCNVCASRLSGCVWFGMGPRYLCVCGPI